MVIDSYVHPLCYASIYTEDEFKYWEHEFGMGLMGPLEYDELFAEMHIGGVQKSFLMPLDVSTISGGWLGSNEQMAKIVSDYPDRFINFASVDPHRSDAVEILERAFVELNAKGAHFHPAKQRFYTTDACMDPIYELCMHYQRPIYFDAGLSWEPETPLRYNMPTAMEETIMSHPKINFALAHFAWPWVREMVALMLKYPNVYTDTSVLYLDSPEESIERLFKIDMGPLWFQRSFQHQIMFASNTPRFRSFKICRAIEKLGLSDEANADLLGKNALRFLGMGEQMVTLDAVLYPLET